MEIEVANRIIEIAMKWTHFEEWCDSSIVAAEFLKAELDASQNWTDFETLADGLSEDIDETECRESNSAMEILRRDAGLNHERAETLRRQIDASQNEFKELENLIREHAPQLLEHVPTVNLSLDSLLDDAEFSQLVRDLRKIEGEVRIMLKPQKRGNKKAKPKSKLRCYERDKEFCRLSDEGESSKEIAAIWNRIHPNENVSEATVRTQINRFRKQQDEQVKS